MIKDIQGLRFGRLIVGTYVGSDNHGKAQWWCL